MTPLANTQRVIVVDLRSLYQFSAVVRSLIVCGRLTVFSVVDFFIPFFVLDVPSFLIGSVRGQTTTYCLPLHMGEARLYS